MSDIDYLNLELQLIDYSDKKQNCGAKPIRLEVNSIIDPS